MEFTEILNTFQALAIANQVSPTEISWYNSICRYYSKAFHTPLHLVLEMDPEHVLLNYYEDKLESMDLDKFENIENLMDTILTIEDPEYAASRNKEEEDFVKQAEKEEEERLKAGRSIFAKKSPSKTLLEKEEIKAEKKPTGGYVNFDLLNKLDEES